MLRRIFFNNDNVVDISFRLAEILGLKITKTTLQQELQFHPDYPSLLSIHDVFQNYGVETLAVKIGFDKLSSLPSPFLIQVKDDETKSNLFLIVKSVSEDSVCLFEPTIKKWRTISITDFNKYWDSGIVLLIDASESVGEKSYSVKLTEEKRRIWSSLLSFLLIPLVTVILCTLTFFLHGKGVVESILFTLVTLFGSIISGLLLWYELDQFNPVLQQICGLGKKTNCGAVLNSKAASIFGISWSTIGFTYFTGGTLLLLLVGINNAFFLTLLSWFNVLAAPYILFSLYYQWRIAKQWCVLCLCIQGCLLLQLVVSWVAGWHTELSINLLFHPPALIQLLVAYSIPFIVVSLAIPALKSAKQSKQNKQELQRLKHNPQIFDALLQKQRSIADTANGLGIRLGNPTAKYTITKVCNPYCGPCAKAHVPMEELLQSNPNVQLQIIFTATSDGNDRRMPPVRHLLAIAAEDNDAKIIQALDDWYLADKKEYEMFAEKYPMDGELEKQDTKIDAMNNWCKQVSIIATPTFFINGNQLPDIYNVQDLKYFLSA